MEPRDLLIEFLRQIYALPEPMHIPALLAVAGVLILLMVFIARGQSLSRGGPQELIAGFMLVFIISAAIAIPGALMPALAASFGLVLFVSFVNIMDHQVAQETKSKKSFDANGKVREER